LRQIAQVAAAAVLNCRQPVQVATAAAVTEQTTTPLVVLALQTLVEAEAAAVGLQAQKAQVALAAPA
jgi:hypothetical protein